MDQLTIVRYRSMTTSFDKNYKQWRKIMWIETRQKYNHVYALLLRLKQSDDFRKWCLWKDIIEWCIRINKKMLQILKW